MMLPDHERAFYIDEACRLLADALDTPELAAQVDDKMTFLDAGINSGEIIRLLYLCEAYLGIEIDDDEMFAITSLQALAAMLHRYRTGG
ncbi:acyl carrier protein [Mastigocladopsis repens]|uniref:acyl carrier protein n=1 Tax=Mastigocladopsis repens TaxID=221287 RepID=UPI000381A258|nr:acyl carrier protein [Mastigocladopsis repens]